MKQKAVSRKRMSRKQTFLILVIVVLPVLALWIYKQNTTFGVTFYEVASDKLPSEFDLFRIVQISDLHDAEFGENQIDLIKEMETLAPDVIVITGDLIDSNRYDLEKSLTVIKGIQFIAPIYYVTGNHEIATTKADTIKRELKALGVIVLTNEAKYVKTVTGSLIAIGGIEDPLASSDVDEVAIRNSVEQVFEKVPDDRFKILLSHRPEYFQLYIEEGIDLTFSGHAHGGQFRIPGLGGLVSPGQGWFPTFTSGLHEENEKRMIVSRGLGNSIIPIRLLNQPELVLVTLKRE